MNDTISCINISNLSLKRIIKDIKEINEIKEYDYIYNSEYNTIILNYKNKHISINIDNYPFKPPTIKINNILLVYNPSNFPSRLWKRYIKMYPDKCACCNTILCVYNWSPCLRLKHILNEYSSFIEKLKIIGNILMFEHIYLPDDIINEITSFLI